ncbi:MAG: hypothetical protein KKE79_04825, partial [Actinobacteria bacterium]|nr:hypothetical protein [Actinomycetota bacterium]
LKDGGAPEVEILKYEIKGSQLAFGPAEDVENGALWCGQVAIRLEDIPTAAQVVERIMNEAEEILKNLSDSYL